MVLLTLLARVTDGLPLSASIDNSNEKEQNLQVYQNQAKQLFRKLSHNSPSRCTLESGPMLIHYQIEQGVCFLIICHHNFSKKLAFNYLAELAQSFLERYAPQIGQASRPYTFIEFETTIRKLMKSYTDSRSPKQLSKINNDLADVQRIMVQNIEDVIQRGEQLSVLDNKANNLSMMSRQYKKESHQLNLNAQQWKYIAAGVGFVFLFLFLRYWVF
ncbi:hypothetical protein ACHWQZ_G016772 [Mnemiopsis leidyi]